MGREATGSAFQSRGKWFARVTLTGPKDRPPFALPWCPAGEPGRKPAKARAALMADWAARMLEAGRGTLLRVMLEDAAKTTNPETLAKIERTVKGYESSPLAPRPKAPASCPTFLEFAEQWTSGALSKQWPDHVPVTRRGGNALGMLKKHVPADVASLPIGEFTLEHAERVMQSVTGLEQSSRSLLAGYVHRVVSLAVYPAKHLQANPIPKGWRPKRGPGKALAYLYPSEDSALMEHERTPLARRFLYGFLAREGMRVSEALALEWPDLDLQRGAVRLDQNKTDDPRAWALDPGTALALTAWRKLQGEPETGRVFPSRIALSASGQERWPAIVFRDALKSAGVNRPELYETKAGRRPVRVHDLRATFVTLAMASGRTEAWVCDRTGHRSSGMLNRYRRTARTASELGLGWLSPLDQAIPEFRPDGLKGGQSSTESSTAGGTVGREVAKVRAGRGISEPAEQSWAHCSKQ